jgi:hypothetical protein
MEVFSGFLKYIDLDLLRVIKESRISRRVLATFNSTFIAIIPNTNILGSFEEFKPIFLCICICKIVAKIIARRVKSLLSKSISQEQFGFFVGRKIYEAMGVAQEASHSIKVKKLSSAVIKIYLSKTYHRVGCTFI